MSDLITPVMTRYANFAMTGDGIPEIQTLAFLEIEAEFPDPLPDQRLALVLVESRLLGSAGDASLKPALLKKLRRLKSDMRAEGLTSRFITASVYQGPIHKDGRIVLAMRRFLRDIKTTFSRLEGVTLVGNFPESTIVRNFAWAPAPDTLVIGPELISERADIVLADLTGAWENLYRQADFSPEKIFGFPDDATVASGWHDGERVLDANFVAKSYIAQNLTFRDAFYLDDAQCTISDRTPTTMRLQLRQAERNSEANAADLAIDQCSRAARHRRVTHQRSAHRRQSESRARRRRRTSIPRCGGQSADRRLTESAVSGRAAATAPQSVHLSGL